MPPLVAHVFAQIARTTVTSSSDRGNAGSAQRESGYPPLQPVSIPPLDPRFKFLPLGIFAVFAFFGRIEAIVVVAMR